jgi:hypothetical protein
VVDAIRKVDPERIRAVLRGSGLSDDAIEGTLERLQEVQKHGKITGEAWPGEIIKSHRKVIVRYRKEDG